MSRSYETEQKQLKAEIQTLQQDIKVQERQIKNLEQFIQRMHKCKDLQKLSSGRPHRQFGQSLFHQ